MGLSSSLQIGRTGLLAGQTGIEVAGNNLANITTRGYHRQSVTLAPSRSHEVQRGVFLGQGVDVQQVIRHVDEALEGRIRNGVADESFSLSKQTLLSQIEAIQNELSDIDLTSQLSEFFNAFSELANTPQDNAVRTVVVQQGQSIVSFVRNLRSELLGQRKQVDTSIAQEAIATDDLVNQLAQINLEITKAERGAGGAHGLRDKRDALLSELSQLIDISVTEQSSGSVDVYVGSLPIVLNNESRGVEIRQETVNGELKVDVVIKDDGSVLNLTSGSLAALVQGREGDVNNAITVLDNFAAELILQVNRLHSQGQAGDGVASVTSTALVSDVNVALNDAASGLDFTATHGSFQLHVIETSTGQRNTSTINIDLDGISPAADTSLTSLAASINAVPNVSATVLGDGRLQISGSTNDFRISFGPAVSAGDDVDDVISSIDGTSNVLAVLGINTFFSGSSATDIAVNTVVAQDPGRVSTAQGHENGDNRTALAIAGLRKRGIESLNGFSLTETWNRHVQEYAVKLGQARQQLEADSIVRENLEAQQQSISGVNADEEAISLLTYQRAYQGSARFISVVDELLQTLINLL